MRALGCTYAYNGKRPIRSQKNVATPAVYVQSVTEVWDQKLCRQRIKYQIQVRIQIKVKFC